MNTNWKSIRETLEAELDRGEVAKFHDPAILELLRDMQDRAPVEFATFNEQLKRRRIATEIKSSLKNYAYREPTAALRNSTDDGVYIEYTYDRKRVIDEVLPYVTKNADVYVQGDALVRVTFDPNDSHPTISRFSAAAFTELLTSTVTLYKLAEGRDGTFRKPVHPEPIFINMILDRKSYPGARVLNGIAEAPLMREDGTLFAEMGYDSHTKYLCTYAGPKLEVSEAPTRDDALQALNCLDDIIVDFPFAEPIHRSAWFSMLFTAILLPKINGPVPVFIVTANVAGAGKTKLVDVVSTIAQGRTAARQPYTDDDRELTASVTATLAQGTSLALFDNVDRPFGGSMIELMSTGDAVSVRRYGHNDSTLHLRSHTMFMATGNNVVPRTRDVVRRVIVIEVTSQDERPEERQGFRHPDLLAMVRSSRAALLSAVMTIVRAFIYAGRPTKSFGALGSFEAWSSAIRELLLWLGLPDPVETQSTMRDEQDAQLAGLHDAWVGMFNEGEARTVNDALHAIEEAQRDAERLVRGERNTLDSHRIDELDRNATNARRLQDALQGLVSQPWKSINAVSLGRQLARFKGRVCKGRKFEFDRRGNTNALRVVPSGLGESKT